jgi:hypothetical protein
MQHKILHQYSGRAKHDFPRSSGDGSNRIIGCGCLGLWVQLLVALRGSIFPGKLDGCLGQECLLYFRLILLRGRWQSLIGPARIMLEHQFAYLARVRDRTCFRFFQTAAPECFKKSGVDVDPEVSLQVIVCLRHIEHAGQHQLFHQFNQSPVSAGASDDQVKVTISLNLSAVFFNAGLGRLSCFLNNLLKLGKIALGETAEAELYGKQIEGIQKCKNLGVVGIGPTADIHTAGRPTLDNSDLFKAVKRIADRRPADIKTLSQILFTEPLVGNQIAFSHPFEDLEDDPVSQCAINGFGRKTRRFVELSKKHISRQYTISPARN